eukprot:1670939-Rhodomonas_salina.3
MAALPTAKICFAHTGTRTQQTSLNFTWLLLDDTSDPWTPFVEDRMPSVPISILTLWREQGLLHSTFRMGPRSGSGKGLTDPAGRARGWGRGASIVERGAARWRLTATVLTRHCTMRTNCGEGAQGAVGGACE